VGDGEEIRLFSENFLGDPDQSDVLEKLARSEADERHAVVIATDGQLGLHTAVDMGLTLGQPPALDSCVDWLWGDRLPESASPGMLLGTRAWLAYSGAGRLTQLADFPLA
jgi:hypothetical protein